MQNVRFVLPVVRPPAVYENRSYPATEVPIAATAPANRRFEKIASESVHGACGEGRRAHWVPAVYVRLSSGPGNEPRPENEPRRHGERARSLESTNDSSLIEERKR